MEVLTDGAQGSMCMPRASPPVCGSRRTRRSPMTITPHRRRRAGSWRWTPGGNKVSGPSLDGDADRRHRRATPDDRDVASNCAVSIIGKELTRSRIKCEARASQLLRAGLQPDRHLDALLVTHHGEPHRGADLIVVETTLQPGRAVDSLAVDGNDDVSGNNRAARFGP